MASTATYTYATAVKLLSFGYKNEKKQNKTPAVDVRKPLLACSEFLALPPSHAGGGVRCVCRLHRNTVTYRPVTLRKDCGLDG